ncbi:tyrosine-type recombinase/integrase [Vibrio cyclitrophicus]
MVGTEISLHTDFSRLRPEHVHQAIMLARKHGTSSEQYQKIQEAINHLLREFNKREERYAKNSLSQLYSNWSRFEKWCHEHEHHPLPAAAETIELFFEDKVHDLHRNSNRSYAWAISKIHRISGCPDPFLDEIVRDKMAGIFRRKVEAGERIVQASAFREKHLDRITKLWRHSPVLRYRRDLALLTVAYETLLRASEIANIRFGHLEYPGDGTALLTIPITKSNHSGEPDTVVFSPEAVDIIHEYVELAGLDDTDEQAFLFVGISRHNTPYRPKLIAPTHPESGKNHKKMTSWTVEQIFNKAWEALNLGKVGIATFTGHSARVGACQDLLTDGYTILQVQQAGRWSTPAMVMRYGRGILAKDGAMAQKRASRGRK